MNIIIHGPQGCGKSHHGAALAAHFGCAEIVHEWDGVEPLPDGALALTNVLPAVVVDGSARTLFFGDACREAGIALPKYILHFSADTDPAMAAMAELDLLAHEQPDAVRRFLESLDSDADLFCLGKHDDMAVGTFDVRIVFEPSQCLREFLAANRASQGL